MKDDGVEKTLEGIGAFIKKERDIYHSVLKQAQEEHNKSIPDVINPEVMLLDNRAKAEDRIPDYVNLDQVIDPTYAILGHLQNQSDIESKRTSLVGEKLEDMFYLTTFCIAIGDIEMAKDAAKNYKEMKEEASDAEVKAAMAKIGTEGVQFINYVSGLERRFGVCHEIIRNAASKYDKGSLGVAIQKRPEIDGGFAKQYMDKYKEGICLKYCQAQVNQSSC